MNNLWNDEEAARCADDLALRVYTSRLLGRDKSLVLHGGGNTSVKLRQPDLFGEPEDVLYVKGSGWDLETIEPAGFSPVRLGHLVRLAGLSALSDPQMVDELVTHMTRAAAPTPSIEAILHALLPHRFVDHTHADAVVAVTNTPGALARVEEIWGDAVLVIPYVMPGFDLARAVAERWASRPRDARGMILMSHGVFSWGDTARASYEGMLDLVGRAEAYLERKGARPSPSAAGASAGPSVPSVPSVPSSAGAQPSSAAVPRQELADLRAALSAAAGFPLVVRRDARAKALAFAARPDVARLAVGPATPDHVIRTKRLPMLGRDVGAYAAAYRAGFAEHAPRAREPKTMLDPAPRVVIDRALGVLTAGRSARDAGIVADIYDHTIDVVSWAHALGGFVPLSDGALFDVEYWDLEQAKLRKGGRPAPLAGEIALVTGAASGIGKACVESLLARGAAVVALDRDAGIGARWRRPDVVAVQGDVTLDADVERALDAAAEAFGGLDLMILNAGVFPGGKRLDALGSDEWRQVMAVNLDANLAFLRGGHPLLKCAPRGGRVVVIGSKNVPAPGPGAAAYSASKAALTQLARVAALEWGADRIRVNVLHPDAVFDTGVWTDEVLAARAAHYGLTVEAYKRKNVLGTEVHSRDVAELAAELGGPLFACVTGAQIPIDGGNDRVI